MVGLCTIPRELFVDIIHLLSISHLKPLRVAILQHAHDTQQYYDTWHDRVIVLRLFSSVCLSRLHAHRHSFLQISRTPHLAAAVHTLVWYEFPDAVEEYHFLDADGQPQVDEDEPELGTIDA